MFQRKLQKFTKYLWLNWTESEHTFSRVLDMFWARLNTVNYVGLCLFFKITYRMLQRKRFKTFLRHVDWSILEPKIKLYRLLAHNNEKQVHVLARSPRDLKTAPGFFQGETYWLECSTSFLTKRCEFVLRASNSPAHVLPCAVGTPVPPPPQLTSIVPLFPKLLFSPPSQTCSLSFEDQSPSWRGVGIKVVMKFLCPHLVRSTLLQDEQTNVVHAAIPTKCWLCGWGRGPYISGLGELSSVLQCRCSSFLEPPISFLSTYLKIPENLSCLI